MYDVKTNHRIKELLGSITAVRQSPILVAEVHAEAIAKAEAALKEAQAAYDAAVKPVKQAEAEAKQVEEEKKVELLPLLQSGEGKWKGDPGSVTVVKYSPTISFSKEAIVALVAATENDPAGHYKWLRDMMTAKERPSTVRFTPAK